MKEFPQPFWATGYSTLLSLHFLIMFYLNLPSWKLGQHKHCLPALLQLQQKLSVILMRFAGRIQALKQANCCVLHATPHCENISLGTLVYLEITKWNKHLHVSLYTYILNSLPIHKSRPLTGKTDTEFSRMDYLVIHLDFLWTIKEEEFSQ